MELAFIAPEMAMSAPPNKFIVAAIKRVILSNAKNLLLNLSTTAGPSFHSG
jgi:hypothetical protein